MALLGIETDRYMNTHTPSREMQRAVSAVGTETYYMPGWANDFETEALPVRCRKA